MPAPFLRRAATTPAGWASGGGDTDFDRKPQPILLGKLLTGTETKSAVLPKGTVIIAGVNVPHPPANGDSHAVSSAGDITIGVTDGGTEYLGSTAVENYTRTAISNGVVLASDTRVYFAAVGVTGVVFAGVEVILPAIRP